MKNKAPSIIDELLSIDPNYPINGTYLQKYNFIVVEMNRLAKNLSETDLAAINKEKENLLARACAESSTGLGRYIQYIFSFYPYEDE